MFALLLFISTAVLGFIPAQMAKEKGYSFGLWWLYGWLLFIAATIHISCLPDKKQTFNNRPASIPYSPSSLDPKSDYHKDNKG